jgi:hypothetical protein
LILLLHHLLPQLFFRLLLLTTRHLARNHARQKTGARSDGRTDTRVA